MRLVRLGILTSGLMLAEEKSDRRMERLEISFSWEEATWLYTCEHVTLVNAYYLTRKKGKKGRGKWGVTAQHG